MKVNGTPYRSIWLNDNGWSADIIDQTHLPHEFITRTLNSMQDAAEAISVMRVRGAPLIGATAAYGLALVRSQQVPLAVEELRRAAELQADNARYTYVYAVALDANGETGKAVEVLAHYYENAQNNMEILAALASYTRKTGDTAKADQYDQQLTVLQRMH